MMFFTMQAGLELVCHPVVLVQQRVCLEVNNLSNRQVRNLDTVNVPRSMIMPHADVGYFPNCPALQEEVINLPFLESVLSGGKVKLSSRSFFALNLYEGTRVRPRLLQIRGVCRDLILGHIGSWVFSCGVQHSVHPVRNIQPLSAVEIVALIGSLAEHLHHVQMPRGSGFGLPDVHLVYISDIGSSQGKGIHLSSLKTAA
mmetsp:Transcript_29909/g.84325  ORF Transcript_29909/g.84325 Transcript_29909/m.84325 type:complete len:200 (-) Transcript_29909:2323-2922(-)